MANNLSKEQLKRIIKESEIKSSDPDVGEIAKKALQRAKSLLADLEKSEQNATGKTQPATAANSQSRSNNTHSTNTAPTTENTAANSANATQANAATTQQSTDNTPQENRQQQPADNQPIGSTATTSDAGSGPTIIVDGKEMTMGEVKSKIITYLTHSADCKSVTDGNWGMYIQRQTFRTLLFWIQTFGLFPRPSQEDFPTIKDIGEDYFRSKNRKIIYSLVKSAHEKEGDVTEIVNNIHSYLNQ